MTKETDSYSYEVTLRAVGQALEALGVESFELVLDGDNFVVYGGSESTLDETKACNSEAVSIFGTQSKQGCETEKILYQRNATPPK